MKFTANQRANIVGTYVAELGDYAAREVTMLALCTEYGVKINVIRAILVAEGVYRKQESSGAKGEIVSAFEAVLGVKLPSMHNMSSRDLVNLWDRFLVASEARNVSEGK